MKVEVFLSHVQQSSECSPDHRVPVARAGCVCWQRCAQPPSSGLPRATALLQDTASSGSAQLQLQSQHSGHVKLYKQSMIQTSVITFLQVKNQCPCQMEVPAFFLSWPHLLPNKYLVD